MQFGHRAFLVPAPAVNSWFLIALARPAAALADSASRCRRCYHVFCALCITAFESVLVLYFWLLPRRFAHGPSPSGHAASTTFSGTGIPPWAQLSTLLLALSPMPRCLEALRILFGCCSMALVPSTTCHAACYGLLSGCLFLAVPLLACLLRL